MFVQEQEEPIERLHLYVVRDDDQPLSILPIALSLLSLLLVLAVGVAFPYRPLLVRQTLTVPAILLPLQTFSATEIVIPTGVHIFPATRATGTLTITNGSILAQYFPAGMIFAAANGMEVVTTASVDVPASNGVSFGVATVAAQAVTAGASGNLAPLAIDAVYGISLYIKNDQAFEGGRNSYSIPVIQPQDIKNSLTKARASLIQRTLAGLLERPCMEQVAGSAILTVSWTCQFVTYQVAGKVLRVIMQGRTIRVEVLVPARKQIRETN